MKKLALLVLPVLAGSLLVGCETLGSRDQNRTVFRLEENPRGERGGGSRYGYRGKKKAASSRTQTTARAGQDEGEPDDVIAGGTELLDPAADTPADGDSTDRGSTTDTVKPTTPEVKPPVATSAPFANPVPGKFGHVYSPFAKGKEVDVSGYPPGAEVRCPYTQNIFKVP